MYIKILPRITDYTLWYKGEEWGYRWMVGGGINENIMCQRSKKEGENQIDGIRNVKIDAWDFQRRRCSLEALRASNRSSVVSWFAKRKRLQTRVCRARKNSYLNRARTLISNRVSIRVEFQSGLINKLNLSVIDICKWVWHSDWVVPQQWAEFG